MAIRLGPDVNLTNNILNLDAANPASYNGVGSTWYDLSGNGNHFTLTGTTQPVYDGKSLRFNYLGGNQFAICNNSTCGDFGISSFSIEYVAYFPTQLTNYWGIISNNHGAYFSSCGLRNSGYSLGVNDQTTFQDNGYMRNPADLIDNNSTNNPLKDQIVYHTYTVERYGSNNDLATAILYKASTPITTVNFSLGQTKFLTTGTPPSGCSGVAGDGNIGNTLYNLYLMRSAENAAYIGTGSIYTIKMYNRVLSQSEINSNYQIYRQYYGF